MSVIVTLRGKWKILVKFQNLECRIIMKNPCG